MGPSGSNPFPVAQLMKHSHLSSNILFVEGRVGAAASLETFENPAAWQCCMSRADGTTCCSRYNPVITTGLCSMERTVGGSHTDVVDVETTVVRAITRNLRIPQCGRPSPGYRRLENRELRLKRSDRDS